jgi:hypothetical protein
LIAAELGIAPQLQRKLTACRARHWRLNTLVSAAHAVLDPAAKSPDFAARTIGCTGSATF